tara:strand:- start:62 stop:715 length:654 start_codon:yes stop_codon:yes gene_type:complete
MPVIYSSSDDGWIYAQSTSGDFQTARDATSGTAIDKTASGAVSIAIGALVFAGRGATVYRNYRTFMLFDTSAVPSNATGVKLYIRGASSNAVDFQVAKATQQATMDLTDFNQITGWSTGGVDNSGNVTRYSDKVEATSSWDANNYNEITLSSGALSDIIADDEFKICLIEYDYDLVGAVPSSANLYTGMYYKDSSSPPYIEYTVSAADNSIFFGTNF